MAEAAAQEEVNPNIEVGVEASESDVTDAGRGMTFDDIDSITDDAPAPKAKGSKSEKEKTVKAKVEKVEPSEDPDAAEVEESSKAPDEGDDGELPTGEKRDSVPSLKGSKLTASFNGEDFNIHSGATIPVKVDGEVKNVQVQELMNNYAGSQSWDKRFSDLDTDKNSFQDRVDVLDEYVNEIFTKANSINESDNPVRSSLEVLRLIGNLTGQDSRGLMKNIRGAFRGEAVQYQDMNEIERENWELRQDIEYTNLDSDLESQSRQRAKSKSDARQQHNQTLERFNIDQAKYRELSSYLSQHSESGEAPSLEQVVQYDRIVMSHNALKAFDENRLGDESLRQQLIDFAMSDPEITQEDLLSILHDSFGETELAAKERKSAENLKRKLGNSSQATKPKPEIRDRKFNNSSDMWDGIS